LHPLHHWESFHSNWATRIADALNERWLPRSYLAEEHTHAGGSLEIDVATFQVSSETAEDAAGWRPPAPTGTLALALPDTFEVRVLADEGGATLVGVIELVSPANKDRPAQRRAFLEKCAGFLHGGVSLVLVDVVTTRGANLHDELVTALDAPALRLGAAVPLYAVAYRPVLRDGATALDVWTSPCGLGEPLPTMPLRLQGDLFVPVDLEATYTEACRRRRITA
jgi:hypothetical protein